jgi:hypothetical protein
MTRTTLRVGLAASLLALALGATPTAAEAATPCPAGGTKIYSDLDAGGAAGVVRIDGVRVAYAINDDRVAFDRASTGERILVVFCVKPQGVAATGRIVGSNYPDEEIPQWHPDIVYVVIYRLAQQTASVAAVASPPAELPELPDTAMR